MAAWSTIQSVIASLAKTTAWASINLFVLSLPDRDRLHFEVLPVWYDGSEVHDRMVIERTRFVGSFLFYCAVGSGEVRSLLFATKSVKTARDCRLYVQNSPDPAPKIAKQVRKILVGRKVKHAYIALPVS